MKYCSQYSKSLLARVLLHNEIVVELIDYCSACLMPQWVLSLRKKYS